MTSLEDTHAVSSEIFLCFTGANNLVHAITNLKKVNKQSTPLSCLKKEKSSTLL